MSKIRSVEILDQAGIVYGQINRPDDFIKAQEFNHKHVETVTQDFLTGPDTPEVAGCNYNLTSGLSIHVASGRIYRLGQQYEAAQGTFTLVPANSTYSRIDLIIATLADDVPGNYESLAFQRIRTNQEYLNSIPPYPPQQFNRATEKYKLATISVKTGTPAPTPVAPALAANEVLLYTITVPAAATALTVGNVVDSRKQASNISGINDLITEMLLRLKNLEIQTQTLVYRYPTILSGDGKCPRELKQDENGVWVVDIPIGVDVEFGDAFIKIRAENFTDPSVNARYINISNGVITYLPLVVANGNPGSATTGNYIRFNVPPTTKTLFLNRAGELFFRSVGSPSGPTECVLMKTTRNGSNPPVLKGYRNIRNSISGYSKTRVSGDASSIQFELDLGVPAGVLYGDIYAVRAADNVVYRLPGVNVPIDTFDGIVDVTGVTVGDTWHANFFILSAL